MEDHLRRTEHQRVPELEQLLEELNTSLEKIMLPQQPPLVNKFPMIFVMGCARSGTTLFTQWLASLGHFGYPSNFISRFYKAPVMGAKIQKIMVDFDHKEELIPKELRSINFRSKLGKGFGLLQPHEFWYFWRRFFKFGDIQQLSQSELDAIDSNRLVTELALLEQEFQKPLMLKGMILNWHIPFLNQIFYNPLFIDIRRDPSANAQGLLRARKNFYGNESQWYSFKPPEFPSLKDQSPETQVASQVYYTRKAISEGLSQVDGDRTMVVDYEEFCADPSHYYAELSDRIGDLGYALPSEYSGINQFTQSNKQYSQTQYQLIKEIYEELK